MNSNLPPLSSLVAFEAAGRLQSFTRAAAELNVTQAAVSRQIRLLEDHLGRQLFRRAHRAVELTNEGRDYLHTIANALNHVGTATRELKTTAREPRLTIAADQSMATLWLLPRLQAFRQEAPGLNIRLIADDDEDRIFASGADVALVHGDGDWPLHQSAMLFADDIVPVCSPEYLMTRQAPQSASDFVVEALIDLEDEHWNWLNWRQWLTSQGVSMAAGPRGLVIDSYPLVIDAALRGSGFALGWRGLIDDALAEGRLVAPLATSLKTRFGYYIVWPRNRTILPEAQIFIDWALRNAA